MTFERPQHNNILRLLNRMNGPLLTNCQSFFGGGTAIVLQNGEYRLSLDVDFLCADIDGYRELRSIAVGEDGVKTIFGPEVEVRREFRADQYGIRGFIALDGQATKVEFVREARTYLEGTYDEFLGVPVLSVASQFAEKLMANADRCLDRAVAYRDAIDLGYLVKAAGEIPEEAATRAEQAYGGEISKKMRQVLEVLVQPEERARAANALQMNLEDVQSAAAILAAAAASRWPEVEFAAIPFPVIDNDEQYFEDSISPNLVE